MTLIDDGWRRNACGQCRYACPMGVAEQPELHECVANPPTVLWDSVENEPTSIRPMVLAEDVACRMFAPRCNA